MPPRWRSATVPAGTVVSGIEDEFRRLDARYPEFLPEFAGRRALLLGSDYSGESSGAPYAVFSHLITSVESWAAWEPVRLKIRSALLSDARRMSFKRLGDGQRKRALAPILDAANSLEGISISIAVSARCPPFFPSPPLDLANPKFAAFRDWKPAVLQKAFFVVHILGCLLAGLAQRGQDVLWLTDEDAIAANADRVRQLTELFAWISSRYLTIDLGHLRCSSSRSDDGSRRLEDFLALPDLIAGAIAEQLILPRDDVSLPSNVFWMMSPALTGKASAITWWLSDARQPLRRLVCIIDPDESAGWRMSWFHFEDQIP